VIAAAPSFCCDVEVHELLKLDDAAWSALELLGYQSWPADGYEPEERFEVRNCSCGSTLYRRAKPAPTADTAPAHASAA
jgi:hypothetical protein